MRKDYGPKWWKISEVVFLFTNISFNAHGDFVNIENDSWKNSEVMDSDDSVTEKFNFGFFQFPLNF